MKFLLIVCACLFWCVNASALDLQEVGKQLSGRRGLGTRRAGILAHRTARY